MKANSLSYEKNKCCGCRLCGNSCPKNAITFANDELGFVYPIIDEKKCIDCHNCERVCPIRSFDKKLSHIGAYAAVNRNSEQLSKAASGGVFAALADVVLNQDGVVYGSAMQKSDNEILKVSHIRVSEKNGISLLQGSKYVQSSMKSVYESVDNDLKIGKKVLFSGTPCQVAAVKMKFGDNENLILVDVICHGVPSQQMFTDYLKKLQNKNKKRNIEQFSFRTKESGWGLCARLKTKSASGKIKSYRIPCNISSFYMMFLQCEIYRDSCYECKFATKERVSDVTIGDYWGIEKVKDVYEKCRQNNYDMAKGISCILVNTQKGMKYVKEANLELFKSDYDNIARENHQLYRPSNCPDTRENIIREYVEYGYAGLEKQFNKKLGYRKYVVLLRNKIPPSIRMKIKMILRK